MIRGSIEEQALLRAPIDVGARTTRKSSCRMLYVFLLLMTNICSGILAFHSGRLDARRVYSMDPIGSRSQLLVSWFHLCLSEIVEAVYKGVSRHLVDHRFSQFDLYDNRSRYTATPSKAVDDAWDEIGAGNHSFLLPLQYGSLFGLDQRRNLHVRPPQWGPDKSGYLVQLWASHDVHCVVSWQPSRFYLCIWYWESRIEESAAAVAILQSRLL